MVKEYDLAALIGGNIGSIIEKFGDLSDAQLGQLHDLESASPTKRSTLLSAIDEETNGRAELAKVNPPSGTPATYTQKQVDEMLAQQKLTHDEELNLAVAKAGDGKTPAARKKPVGKPLVIDAKSDNPALVALTGPSKIVFVDDHDVPVDGLPPMTFGATDFTPNGEGVKLDKDVDFPVELPQREITGAFVTTEGGEPVGKAMLVQPFSIGGGRQARLQKGGLAFTKE
ncbi:hypothetical protein [Sphingomonas alpina]|uniref:Uncharacterized protein n=1 Tax=Sphingomonas alpina TaxID=653931 RepID=A0A7H0LHV2_9SPHN|nr:hypothetical protein [Sphingomonas alpina]QNQ09255.1 hypothetical protein H3Z74_21715 [Sphingomonas alpina]